MTTPDNRALWELVDAKFRSGNSIPVERIVITRAEYEAILERPVVVSGEDDMRALVKLARRCLHTGFVWNDHNFEAAKELAKREAEELGIHSLEDANAFIDKINDNRESMVRGKS